MVDYKKLYEETFEKLQNIIYNHKKQGHIIVPIEDIENSFTELKESDDEQHCKWILEYLYDGLRKSDEQFKDQFKSAIAWLENRGEKTFDKIVEKARTEKQRVLLTETDGSANIDWDCRSLDDVKILLKCGLEFIRTIEADKQILADNRFGGCSFRIPTRYDNGIKHELIENQKEQKPIMIQWTGDNLKEVIDFTGKSPRFDEWFKSWDEYEEYVHSHGNIIKLFCEDGSYYEVPVGAWIVNTPDGYNVASMSRFVNKHKEVNPTMIEKERIDNAFTKMMLKDYTKQKPVWSEEDEKYWAIVIAEFSKCAGKSILKDEWMRCNDFLHSLRDRYMGKPSDGLMEAPYDKPVEWSEKDSLILDSIISVVEEWEDNRSEKEKEYYGESSKSDWLKSLKGRIQPQSKQEWSEKDKERIQRIYTFLWKNRKGDTDTIYQIEKDAEWLKNLNAKYNNLIK